MKAELRQQWLDLQHRLARQGERSALALSVRIPGAASLWYGTLGDAAPCAIELTRSSGGALDHALIYRSRPDVGAIIQGAGRYGQHVADFGGQLPQLFDEQARHLGRMAPAVARGDALAEALADQGNVQLLGGQPLCLGTTASRAALNAELFEKCAKAYTLAQATGAVLTRLPWWVVLIATRRLQRDQRAAAEAFRQGRLPAESRGY
ncbi:class II aldolase/adducin family protein [Pseudomonas sp. AS2.8]|uniref:class II aldolase/adducin family protein n=1 Tax=Pseudomonas sp. AS2.8 TaxID=2587128 RepID=UPI00160FEF10|nr:class II aldolase/adducin family protein [Pseudomonas sp. AS2.8]MBB2895679.1 ribulose-5-phosphate 4-epimerase/fuculose-1-phosphate aldolase [Pseudomonas sp. AS2.8]